uniref:Uncharacterized protein n=2 Tax=Parascaris univalens TaxID=6257 RepID=A0A914ZL57_PARUN
MVLLKATHFDHLRRMLDDEEIEMEHSRRDAALRASGSLSSSMESLDPEIMLAEHCTSDDLDKLSICLSEASSEPNDTTRGSILYDVMQAQLALWTLIFSILYSYAWQQHRKKFIFSLFFIIPTVFTVCCAISALLTVIVILGRLFTTPIGYTELLKYGEDPTTGQTTYPRRHRSYSGTSCRSSMSIRSALSVEDVQLPVPLCRRHSSNGSINSEPYPML